MSEPETPSNTPVSTDERTMVQLPAMPENHHPAKAEKVPRAPAPSGGLPTVLPQTKVAKIATAIADVMREVNVIAKRGYNKFHGYKFAQMQDVLQELTPLLAKHGLMIVQTEVGRAMFDDDRAVSVQYQFTIAHSSGEVWPEHPLQTGLSRCRDSKGGFDDKALNKCHTAARKYFLMALFQIPTGDEDDADRGDNERGSYRRPARPARNVMLQEPYDPETGEIGTAAPDEITAPGAADAAEASEGSRSPGEASAALSLEDLAREAAKRGDATFRQFYRARSEAEKQRLSTLGTELRTLIDRAERKTVNP